MSASAEFQRQIDNIVSSSDQREFAERCKHVIALTGKSAVMAKRRFEKDGKRTARERIQLAVDPGSEFVELSMLAAFGLYGGETHSAGVVTGIGRICDQYCMVFSNEGAVKGGTWVEPSCRKVLRAQELAQHLNLACIYIVDSGGAFLPDQANVYPELFGRIFRNQAEMSSVHAIPQIAVVVGLSTAGGAYVPAMCDHVIITQSGSSIFLAGPPLVKSAIGEVVDADTLGGGRMHTTVSGVADYIAKDEVEALSESLRVCISHVLGPALSSIDHPAGSPAKSSEIRTSSPPRIAQCIFNKISTIYQSEGAAYSRASLSNGRQCHLLESWSSVADEAFHRIAALMSLTGSTPVVILEHQWGFLQNGMSKGAASFIKALTRVKFKIGIVTSGTASVPICSKGFNPGLMFVWPGVKVHTTNGDVDCYTSTAVINDDGIISPASTASVLSVCLDVIQCANAVRASL